MAAETLHLHYTASPRGNRRRPKQLTLPQIITRLVLLFVALFVLIAFLIKRGFFHESVSPVFVATGFAL